MARAERLVVSSTATLLWALMCALLAASEVGATIVFLSTEESCIMGTTPVLLSVDAGADFYVCIDGGSTVSAGEACENGLGDELCAFDVTITASGALSFLDFFHEPDFGGAEVVEDHDDQTIRANGLPMEPILGAARIGRVIIVHTADQGGSIRATGETVSAALQVEPILDQILAVSVPEPVPEPDGMLLLISGIAGLMALEAHRRARGIR